jgi:hypothetical protein
MPTIGMLEMNSGITGFFQASSSRRLRLSALIRSAARQAGAVVEDQFVETQAASD